jgi:hypothetical protein
MKLDLRIRCVLWGCWTDENGACPKCGCALYDADFVQEGRLHWFQQAWWRLRHGVAVCTTRHCVEFSMLLNEVHGPMDTVLIERNKCLNQSTQ